MCVCVCVCVCVCLNLPAINACNASLRSEKFSQMAKRTRRQYLLDLVQTSCTSLGLDQIGGAGIAGNATEYMCITVNYRCTPLL